MTTMTMDLFKTYSENEAQAVSLEQVYNLIVGDAELARLTALHRDLLARGATRAAKDVKERTAQVAVSFRMAGGKGRECCGECLYQVVLDFDAKSPSERLPAEELERVKTVLRTSYHARLGYESLSGLGYHVVVPFVLPEGVEIDMSADAKRGEEIFQRAYRHIARLYEVWCGHEMDMSCKNVNRMMGLSHDAQAVLRPDARPVRLTRESLGLDAEGRLVRMRTPRRAQGVQGAQGEPTAGVPLGDHLARAVRTVEEEAGLTFAPGSRHDFVMRVAFVLNRMGVDEAEAAKAVDDEWLGRMDGRPSAVLHSCYRRAQDEFGVWATRRPKGQVKTELVHDFLGRQALQYDVLTQKTRQRLADGHWQEMLERDENDLYLRCCREQGVEVSERLFHTVLNSSVVPMVNPLREYVAALPEWHTGDPDYIGQVASMVHMLTAREDAQWAACFRKWFVAMVAGWTDDAVVNHQVIVLVGRQGIYKSTWLNRLVPPALSAYTTDNIDIERLDKDEQMRAAEYGLINIDELDKLSDRQLNRLKSMITTQHVDMRAPYGRHKEKRLRVASYAASGNKTEFLTDQTGNRRWLPFHVQAIDSPFRHPMPYDGMYAQARHLLAEGFNYWFDEDDIRALEQHVEEFMVPTSEEQLIPLYFSPVSETDAGAVFLTLAEIGAKVTTYGNLKKNPDPRRLGAIMTKLGFKKERKGHDGRRGYYVREHLQTEIEALRHPDIF